MERRTGTVDNHGTSVRPSCTSPRKSAHVLDWAVVGLQKTIAQADHFDICIVDVVVGRVGFVSFLGSLVLLGLAARARWRGTHRGSVILFVATGHLGLAAGLFGFRVGCLILRALYPRLAPPRP